MTQSKAQKERQWTVRKQSQNPHGKIKSLEEIADEITPSSKETSKISNMEHFGNLFYKNLLFLHLY
jgi:hypothetical protein